MEVLPPQYKVLKDDRVEINVQRAGDCCVRLKDGNIVMVKNLARHVASGKMVLIGCKFKFKDDLYTSPLTSSSIGVNKVYGQCSLQMWPVDKISHKYFRIPLKEKFAVLPLLH